MEKILFNNVFNVACKSVMLLILITTTAFGAASAVPRPAPNEVAQTALFGAIEQDDPDGITAALHRGADIKGEEPIGYDRGASFLLAWRFATKGNQRTPLEVAVHWPGGGTSGVFLENSAKKLFENGADPSAVIERLIIMPTVEENIDVTLPFVRNALEKLLDFGVDPNGYINGHTYLIYAVDSVHGISNFVNIFLKQPNIDLNLTKNGQITPLGTLLKETYNIDSICQVLGAIEDRGIKTPSDFKDELITHWRDRVKKNPRDWSTPGLIKSIEKLNGIPSSCVTYRDLDQEGLRRSSIQAEEDVDREKLASLRRLFDANILSRQSALPQALAPDQRVNAYGPPTLCVPPLAIQSRLLTSGPGAAAERK